MKILSKNTHSVIKQQDADEADTWSVPNVTEETNIDENKTNALGKVSNWRFEPPEETEIEQPQPLTAEDIEEIRLAAFEEGFSQGKEEGLAKGFEEGQVTGHQEGLKSGHQEGHNEGLEAGKAEIEQQCATLAELITQMHQPLANIDKNVEAQLLHLVVQLTQAITLHEAKTNADILISAIAEGIKALPSQDAQTQILLNPQDIAMVEQQYGAEHIQEQGWRLLPAPQLASGSCQIENSTSNIDLSIKSRINDVLESFLQAALHQ